MAAHRIAEPLESSSGFITSGPGIAQNVLVHVQVTCGLRDRYSALLNRLAALTFKSQLNALLVINC